MKLSPVSGRVSQMLMAFAEEHGGRKTVSLQSLLVDGYPLVRMFKDLKPVLYDAASCKDFDPGMVLYTVYRGLYPDEHGRALLMKHDLRYDVTVMPSVMLGREYVKTIGHEHQIVEGVWSDPEVLEVLEGEASFLIERYKEEEVADVSLVTAHEGDVVIVPPYSGHVTINVSSKELVVGNLVSQYCLERHERFVMRRGGSYYLLEKRQLVKNASYGSVPEVRVVDAVDNPAVQMAGGLLRSFMSRPNDFEFLTKPWAY